ncbi:MAG TPA: class I SAM-dependent methyltransferase [Gemmatimonadaceae bacterium]|jgi:SAM-dependent methyltransferase
MDSRDAGQLIAPAVHVGERWADLGAGTGTFTRALARLVGAAGTVYAIERDRSAIVSLEALARDRESGKASVVAMRADFTQPLELPPLDGALFANALHFIDAYEQANVLRRIAERLENDGAIVVVEYDNRPPSRWVPFPLSLTRLAELSRIAHLGAPELIGQRRSMFGGSMYAARVPRRSPMPLTPT